MTDISSRKVPDDSYFNELVGLAITSYFFDLGRLSTTDTLIAVRDVTVTGFRTVSGDMRSLDKSGRGFHFQIDLRAGTWVYQPRDNDAFGLDKVLLEALRGSVHNVLDIDDYEIILDAPAQNVVRLDIFNQPDQSEMKYRLLQRIWQYDPPTAKDVELYNALEPLRRTSQLTWGKFSKSFFDIRDIYTQKEGK